MWKLRYSALVLWTLAAVNSAAAHVGEGGELHWNVEAWVIVSLTAAMMLYGFGLRSMRIRRGGRSIVGRVEIATFVGGIASLVVALLSPLDALGAELFSGHMVQHLVLMLVAAPLFVRARPLIVFLWALPRGTRKALGRLWSGGGLGGFFKILTAPLSVWLAFCGLFAFWHLPRPYSWALAHEPVHVVEHLCFFVSAFAFWSVVIEPSGRRRLDYGATLLFVATAAILSALPGALMVLTSRAFYPAHAEGATRWGLTLLEDQHLAGLIMWIPAGFVYMAAIGILFVLWLRASEKRAAASLQKYAAMSSTVVLLLVVAGCEEVTGVQSPSNVTPVPASFDGDPGRGAVVIAQTGCGSCHTIPGITGANGLVGPPLTQMGRRIYVAGLLRNTPDNMVTWLRDPQVVVPGNAMPNMGLQDQQARDIAAYLYTLQ
ncbi:cytochrome c oxidase assembly protein [Microvirga sp. TS319]|uniref:cytochrome c oxidase assembly protein n=1 Tax=Microvirga sp. TS319 TaxID=3241165 RepID=UPI00351A7284